MRRYLVSLIIIIITSFPLLGCTAEDVQAKAVPFSIEIAPLIVTHAYVGQAYKFSVTVSSEETSKSVNISALVNDCYITVNPEKIKPGEVSRLTVVPLDSAVGKTLIINIEGERSGLVEQATAKIAMGDTGDSKD